VIIKLSRLQLLLNLTFNPLLGLMMLAMWTTSMTARMRDELLMIAVIARDSHHRAVFRSAGFNDLQRFQLTG
jgi:hypothetical protein